MNVLQHLALVELARATPSPLEMSASTCEVRSRYSLQLATPQSSLQSGRAAARSGARALAAAAAATGRLPQPTARLGNLFDVVAKGRCGWNPPR